MPAQHHVPAMPQSILHIARVNHEGSNTPGPRLKFDSTQQWPSPGKVQVARSIMEEMPARVPNLSAGDDHGSIDRIVIVGAGDCGTRAAMHLREYGFEGEVTLVGEESVVPYERPALSKDVLLADDAQPREIASVQQLNDQAIRWIAGVRASRIERERRQVVLSDNRVVPYDRLLLATGSRARQTAMASGDLMQSVRSVGDAVRVRSQLNAGTRLLVIGGGFVGLEVASIARQRGCEVTVIEFANRLMSRVVPAAVAQIIHDAHLAHGVDLRCGVAIDRIDRAGRGGRGLRVTLDDGTTVSVDVGIAGIGAIPNTELGATAGLSIANGIAVDATLRTNDGAIYAAGDCCSVPHPLYGGTRIRLEAFRNALDHAQVAARNLLGGNVEFNAVPWFWSDQYDLGLQIAGLHAAATREVARRRADGSELRFGLDNGGRIVSASGVAEGAGVGRDIRISEMLIAGRATPRTTDLSDPSIDLRALVVRRENSGVARSAG
jgi:3-phenylpropionate/trans-cinnamate dioxygenase ferredoxin reductase component